MSLVRNSKTASAEKEQRPRDWRCAAHGCPMPGTICSSTHPNEQSQWLCRFHFGEPLNKWPRITQAVNAMSREERHPSTSHYQPGGSVPKKFRFASPGKAWAQHIVAARERGDYPSDYGYRMACAVLGGGEEPELA